MTSLVRAGFVDSTRPPGASAAAMPPTTEVTVRLIFDLAVSAAA
jgi:hypothetical protein